MSQAWRLFETNIIAFILAADCLPDNRCCVALRIPCYIYVDVDGGCSSVCSSCKSFRY